MIQHMRKNRPGHRQARAGIDDQKCRDETLSEGGPECQAGRLPMEEKIV
jgi:hypothetical protein